MASFVVSSALAGAQNVSVSPITTGTPLCSNYCTTARVSALTNKETSNLYVGLHNLAFAYLKNNIGCTGLLRHNLVFFSRARLNNICSC